MFEIPGAIWRLVDCKRITARLPNWLAAQLGWQEFNVSGKARQTANALHQYIQQRREPLEETLRGVLREELSRIR